MIELLRLRRSIRKYARRPISPDHIELLTEALLRAPSSRGINPWEFVLVDDPHLLAELSLAKEHGSSFLKKAALGIVICADSRKSDVWVEDCAIAAMIVQLTAQSLGLGSCWIQIRKRRHSEQLSSERYVQRVLRLPRHLKVASIISLGYPAEVKKPIPQSKLAYSKILRNRG
jgi:nitroreductase